MNSRESMAKAYDFALEKVGMDFLAYPLYADYISFLRAVPAAGQFAENQKITAVRKVYQRGIVMPLLNIEQLWAEYCNFEKSVNSTLAEKLISDRNKEYQIAKRVAKNMEVVCRGLNRQLVSVPPKGTHAELKQLELWKSFIQWEEGNPLSTEDYSLFSKRVVYAYEQALLCLGYHPDLWYEAALFMQKASKTLMEKGDAALAKQLAEEVSHLYEKAITTLLKDNPLIYFAYADFEEEKMRYQKVESIYQRLIAIESIDPTLAYIQHMKFARRTEGIKTARTVFKKAREDSRSKFHVFVAAALMEFYCSKDSPVAIRIFELGLKKYSDSPEYALAFVDFLSHLNEDNNTRVVFERILTSGSLPPEESLEVWDRFLEFETQVGDLQSILKVDKRRRDALSAEFSHHQTLLLIDRYKFMDLLPCSTDQLKILGFTNSKLNLKSSYVGSLTDSGKVGSSSKDKINGPAAGKDTVNLTGYPMPNTAQMIPFKPKIITTSSYHPISGGVFPPPPAVAHLMSLIPPPWSFNGPFVGVDTLLDSFRSFKLPDQGPNPDSTSAAAGGSNGKMGEIKKDLYQLLATTPDPIQLLQQEGVSSMSGGGGGGRMSNHHHNHNRGGGMRGGGKRRRNSDDDDDSHLQHQAAPPSFDIYRQRQQNKRN